MNRRNFISSITAGILLFPVLAKSLAKNRPTDANLDWRVDEWTKCKNDVHYFVNNYVYVQSPQQGRTLFRMYKYQSRLLSDYIQYKKNVILTARQMGISNLSLAYALWE